MNKLYKFKDKDRSNFISDLISAQYKYNWNNSAPLDDIKYINDPLMSTRLWDVIQTSYHCCGLTSTTDWHHRSPNHKKILPKSCCSPEEASRKDGIVYCEKLGSLWNDATCRNSKIVVPLDAITRATAYVFFYNLILRALSSFFFIKFLSCSLMSREREFPHDMSLNVRE